VPDRIEHVFRREHGRCVATLIRFLGDIDLAEEAVRDAFTIALAPGSTGPCPPAAEGIAVAGAWNLGARIAGSRQRRRR
jgi:RNA polymerase sigma-70 factor, ECF subfamily